MPSSGLDLVMALKRIHTYGASFTTLLLDASGPGNDIDIHPFNEIMDEASKTCRFLVYDYPPNQPTSHIVHHGFMLPFPRLENLQVYTAVSEGVVLELPLAPPLQTLSITYREGPNTEGYIPLDWFPRIILSTPSTEQLKYLSIQSPLSNVEDLHRGCPELRTLRLDCTLPDFVDTEGAIRLPHLQHLYVNGRNDSHLVPLHLFDSPRLECLHISPSQLGFLPLSTHFPCLRILSLHGSHITESASTFLETHPLIEQLLLQPSAKFLVPSLRHYLLERPNYLPSLQVVQLITGRLRKRDAIDLLEARPGPDNDARTGDVNVNSDRDGPPALRVSPGSSDETLPEKYRTRVRRDPEVDWSWDALWASCKFNLE